VALTTHHFVAPGSSMARAIPVPPFSACIARHKTAFDLIHSKNCGLGLENEPFGT
jgi:hypothetical protein